MEAMHMNEAAEDIIQKRLPNKIIQYVILHYNLIGTQPRSKLIY